MDKKKIAFYTIGCKLNYAETSTIARNFCNYKHVNFDNFADIYIINSCSVTKNAEKKLKYIVRSAIRKNPKAKIVVLGCYAESNSEKVSSIKGVDLFLGAENKFYAHKFIVDVENGNNKNKLKGLISRNNKSKFFSFHASYSIGNRTRSFLKIQDGCDYKCSYCVIPFSRGPSRSEKIDNVLRNINFLFEKGIKEIVLTGVNIGSYGGKKNSFFELIKIIEKNICGKGRIRLSSIEPNLLTDECIEFISISKFFVPHFHIPLQSGSNEILGKMRRRYKKELYEKKVKKIRNIIPYAYIGSDVIVGFPGENNNHFLETFYFLKKLNISYIHVFTYSPRPYTLFENFIDTISKKLQKKKSKILKILSKNKYATFCKKQINMKKIVLFEKTKSKNEEYLYGYTENFIRVKIKINSSFLRKKYENTLQSVFLKKIDHNDDIVIAKF